MTAEQVKERLVIIQAFADKQPIQVRRKGYTEWATVNPDTTEFRLKDLDDDALEWRIA